MARAFYNLGDFVERWLTVGYLLQTWKGLSELVELPKSEPRGTVEFVENLDTVVANRQGMSTLHDTCDKMSDIRDNLPHLVN